jgi:hypothetical protein
MAVSLGSQCIREDGNDGEITKVDDMCSIKDPRRILRGDQVLYGLGRPGDLSRTRISAHKGNGEYDSCDITS